jgi:hypothetical protein
MFYLYEFCLKKASSASFLDLYLEFHDSGQLSTKIYDKREDFNFKIINFPNMCSNIPASNSCQSSTIFGDVNVKNIFTSHIDKKNILDIFDFLSSGSLRFHRFPVVD